MKNNQLMYVLIVIGIVLILALGVNIGLNINKKEETREQETNKTINNVDIESNQPAINTNNDKVNNNAEKHENEIVKNNNNDNKIVENNSSENNKAIDSNNNSIVSYSLKDNKVINKLSETYENVKNDVNDGTFKEKAKATFISLIDFLFYDGEIDGVTFNELTTKGKEKVLELANKIDATLEKKAPGYKDTIQDKKTSILNKASELINKGTTSLDNFLKSKLDTNDYEELINAKNELVNNTKNATSFLKENGGKLWESAKEKADTLYQIWKNK